MLGTDAGSRAAREAQPAPSARLPADLFAGLEAAGALLLAVSGGPDSMALMRLAARWADALGAAAPRLHVACVDHGLRPAAAEEARLVGAAAAELGFEAATLVWHGAKPSTRIQERARQARYALLAAHARAIGATHLLTAHHADDQAETVLMRLVRGSGPAGLAGMTRETQLSPDLVLVRPLLGLTKADLVAICHRDRVAFVEDPSNADTAYARPRLRAQAAALARLGLDRKGLLRLGARMARAEAALEAETTRVERALAPERGPGFYRVGLAPLRDSEPEILLRVLRRAVVAVVDEPGRAVRLDRLEARAAAIGTALRAEGIHRATLAGARLVLDAGGRLEVTPEPIRRRGRQRASSERPAP